MAMRCRALLVRLGSPQDSQMAGCVAILLLICEALLCSLIIWRVPYTEIDWDAYMQQAGTFVQGERDYQNIKGGTGPLVYPAGFLYLYTALRWLTGGGCILPAQKVFAVIYLFNQAVVLHLYVTAQVVPPWALPLLCASKRLHSIFLLRLFNDGPAMLLAHVAAALLLARRWRAAVLLFSAAASIKMNILLMAPSVLLILLQAAPAAAIIEGTAVGMLLQVLLGAPFLLAAPASYLQKAFEFSRVFMHKWTVNLKFLPQDVFQSKRLAAVLLSAHVGLLLLFADHRWCANEGGLVGLWRHFFERSAIVTGTSGGRGAAHLVTGKGAGAAGAAEKPAAAEPCLKPAHVLVVLFSGNFVGIVCARTLHYQFYAWYFHSLPLLLWAVRIPTALRLLLWALVEVVWNVYPPTAMTSAALLLAHMVLLAALWARPVTFQAHEPEPSKIRAD